MATSDSPQTGIYFDQHQNRETTMHVDASSVLTIDGTLNVTSGKFNLPGSLGQGYLNIAQICERITSASGATAKNSSITSVCTRFFKSGRMERKLDDAGFWAFRIKP